MLGAMPLLFALDRELGIKDGHIYDDTALKDLDTQRKFFLSMPSSSSSGDSDSVSWGSDSASSSSDSGSSCSGGGSSCSGGGGDS